MMLRVVHHGKINNPLIAIRTASSAADRRENSKKNTMGTTMGIAMNNNRMEASAVEPGGNVAPRAVG
jgi:hypothetical protein